MLNVMRHKWHNIPRFTAVLLLLIAVIGAIYLYLNAPASVTEGIGNATIRTEQITHLVLSGNQFTCPDHDGDKRSLTCTVLLEGKTLEMQLNTTKGAGTTITSCSAHFGGTSVACQGSYSMRYWAPIIILEDTLGISDNRFSQLRWLYWRDQLSEATWLRITLVFASLLALNVTTLLWQSLSEREMKLKWRTAVTLVGSLATFLLLQLSSTIILLFQGWID